MTQGGFPRVTTKGRVCWPAAKSPQASALPGIQGSQGFRGHATGTPPQEGAETVRGVSPPPVLSTGPAPGEVDGRVWKKCVVRGGGRNHLLLHILSDPIWVGILPASLKVSKRFSWGGP
jgi:hypothetical protein